MEMKKGNRNIKIILLIVGILILASGVFLAGKIFGENRKSKQKSDTPTDNPKTKKQLEDKLLQIKTQLNQENNPEKKKELETEQKNLEQQIQNLGGSDNNNNNNNPSKTTKTIAVECNGAVGGKHEYINTANHKERVLIDAKNKIFYSNNALYIKGNQYTISFNEKDAEKKGNNFIFDENNDKLQLTPTTTPGKGPGPTPPNNDNKIELEVRWSGTLKPGYVMFGNKGQGITDDGKNKMLFYIQESHPIFKGKKIDYEPFENPFTTPNPIPKFKLSFLEKDALKQEVGGDEEYLFDENNTKFTLTPLGNWPSPGNNNHHPTKHKITWELEYTGAASPNYLFTIKSQGGLNDLVMIEQANPALFGFRFRTGERFNFSFWTDDPLNGFRKKIFDKNETIEIEKI